jgi:DNA helicase-2/ATP-dependent DNA helicase PcrA
VASEGADEHVPVALAAGLTPAQRDAIMAPDQPLCVLAAAGSGKTTVLTRRVARRVLDGSGRAEHTMAVTFTRKAAAELRRRLSTLGVPDGVRAGTFHALAYAQLRRYWADRDRRPAPLVSNPASLVGVVAGTSDPAERAVLAGEIHWAQVRLVTPAGYAAAAARAGRFVPGVRAVDIAGVMARYQDEKARRGVLDLDDLVTTCASVLEEDEAAAAALRWRTRHLYVDEFQDVNPAQWRLLRSWLGDGNDLFVVGDPRQAIFGWNGADPTLLDRLPDLLPGLHVVRLDDNHRSTPQVLAAARSVLASDPARATRPDGTAPRISGHDDEDAEALGVTRWLRAAHRPGRPWSHLAVLARTNARLEPVAEALTRAGIPHRATPVPVALRRAIDALRRLPPRRRVRDALAELVVEETAPLDRAERTSTLATLGRLVDEHALEFPDATVGEFLAWTTAHDDVSEASTDAVSLSTFHRAKGLQWPAVALVGLEDGLVPIVHATTAEALAEERRLLYVAITRAEDELWCSWARTRRHGDRIWACEPSPFIAAVEAATGEPAPEWGSLVARVADLRTALSNAV